MMQVALPLVHYKRKAGGRTPVAFRQCALVRPSFLKNEGQNTRSDQQIKKVPFTGTFFI